MRGMKMGNVSRVSVGRLTFSSAGENRISSRIFRDVHAEKTQPHRCRCRAVTCQVAKSLNAPVFAKERIHADGIVKREKEAAGVPPGAKGSAPRSEGWKWKMGCAECG